MEIRNLHHWTLSPKEAIELQKALSKEVRHQPIGKKPKLIAGLDCAFGRDGGTIFAAAVVLEAGTFEVAEVQTAVRKVRYPYIPGLLTFREAPVCLAAVKKLKMSPDVFMIDGQGVAHPRRLGLAAHLGLFFDKPTIGCAKSRLTGENKEPKSHKGSFTDLKDKDEIIGAVLRTRDGVKPVFVSVGHACTLADAIKVTLNCAVKYRLPEPTRLAHQHVSKLKLKI